MSTKEDFDRIYSSPGAIWTHEEPPTELKILVDGGLVKPCKVLDLGCGEGFYDIYFSNNGFDVTAIDFSRKAISIAKNNASETKAKINFKVMDVLNIGQMNDSFGFVLEWGLIHHLPREFLDNHISRVSRLMIPGALYLSSSMNITSAVNGNSGEKTRVTPIGTKLEYYSLDELRLLFSKYFDIVSEKVFDFKGNNISQPGNLFLLRKRIDNSDDELKKRLIEIVSKDKLLMSILPNIRELKLPDWYVAGGAVRNTVWDFLHNFKEKTPFNDVDVVYFDSTDLRTDKDTELESFMSKKRPDVKWNFFNQARTHLKNTWISIPVKSTSEGIAYWSEIPTCTGIRLEDDDSITITAPHGLQKLMNLLVEPVPEPFTNMTLYNNRINNKSWKKKWPLLIIK